MRAIAVSFVLAVLAANPAMAQPETQCNAATFSPSKATLASWLGKADIGKGTVETSAEYRARLTTITSGASTIRIAVPIRRDDGSYDADRQLYTIGAIAVGNQFDQPDDNWAGGPRWHGVLVGGTVSGEHQYRASNAFGATQNVLKFNRRKLEVLFQGGDPFKLSNVDIVGPIPREMAKTRLAHLWVVIEGQIADNPIATISSAHPPDRRDPYDVETEVRGLVIVPQCGAVVDARSGDVVVAFDATKLP